MCVCASGVQERKLADDGDYGAVTHVDDATSSDDDDGLAALGSKKGSFGSMAERRWVAHAWLCPPPPRVCACLCASV